MQQEEKEEKISTATTSCSNPTEFDHKTWILNQIIRMNKTQFTVKWDDDGIFDSHLTPVYREFDKNFPKADPITRHHALEGIMKIKRNIDKMFQEEEFIWNIIKRETKEKEEKEETIEELEEVD